MECVPHQVPAGTLLNQKCLSHGVVDAHFMVDSLPFALWL